MSAHLGDRLSAFLDGELPVDERAAVQGHLRECAACARELEELSAVDALARELPVQAPPGYFEALPGRVRARVRARRRPRPIALWAAAAAAAILVAVVAPATLRRAPQPAVAPPAMAPPAADALKERALSTVPPMVPAQPTAVGAPAEAPAGTAERRLQERERDKSQKLDRAASVAARSAVVSAAAPTPTTARAADAVEEAKVSRPDAAKREAPAPAGFAAPPAAAPAGSAAPRRQAVEGFEKAGEPRDEDAKTKDVQAQANELRDDARMKTAQDAAATRAPERKAPVAGAVGGRLASALPADQRYDGLRARRPVSLAEARALRDAWEAFARDQPADARADEARVRAIEAGITAWRLGGGTADLARARASAASYLTSDSAAQRPRVRALLETLPRSPEP